MDPLALVAELTGVEVKLSGTTGRLMASLILMYPYALLVRALRTQAHAVQHAIHGTVGALLLYWIFGAPAMHPILLAVVSYALLLVVPNRQLGVIILFPGSMAYLMYVYYHYATSEVLGDIESDVTAAMCIMMCKVVSIAYDLYDGAAEKAAKKKDDDAAPKSSTSPRALSRVPSPLEYFGWALFPIGVVAGPYMPLIHYRRYIDGRLFGVDKQIPPVLKPVARVLIWCALHAAAFHFGSEYFPDSYWNEPSFYEQSLVNRIWIVSITYRIRLYKYVLVWFLIEGAAILCGIGFSGWKDLATGEKKAEWEAYTNTHPMDLLFCYNFKIIVEVWHSKANDFIKHYVFKRMRRFNNKLLSMLVSMTWLAMWHGLYAGFYITFATEILLIMAEQAIKDRIKIHIGEPGSALRPYSLEVAGRVFFFFVTLAAWGFALVPFCLITWERILPVWNSLYWYGIAGCFAVIAANAFLPRPRRRKKREGEEKKGGNTQKPVAAAK